METDRRQFVRHPGELPLVYRRTENDTSHDSRLCDVAPGGICIECQEPFDPGTELLLSIPAIAGDRAFRGRVVWSNRSAPGERSYQVGLCFPSDGDAFRARMIEQICQIESYRRRIESREGRRLSADDAAREWIERHAADFPSL